VEISNGMRLEARLGRLVAADRGRAQDAVALPAPRCTVERLRCGMVGCGP
jgi:hypothetical protein